MLLAHMHLLLLCLERNASAWCLTDTFTHSFTGGYCSSKVMCNPTIQRTNLQGEFPYHTHESYSWYLQSFSVTRDIPWHGFQTQPMAVHTGAAAGTKGWTGCGIVQKQGKEHEEAHADWLSTQPAHPCPITFNQHVRLYYYFCLFL